MARPRKNQPIENYSERIEAPSVDEIILIHDAALGSGTRKRGDVLGTISSEIEGRIDPESVEASEGVEQIEIKTVLDNPHLFVLAKKTN